jgi:hypothetical protein
MTYRMLRLHPLPSKNPAVLDADVSPRWYQEQPSNLVPSRNSLLTPSGELKDDPEASDDDSFSDRRHQAVDRGRITAYLTHLISDELEDGYVLNVTTRSSRNGEPITTGLPGTAKARQRPRRRKKLGSPRAEDTESEEVPPLLPPTDNDSSDKEDDAPQQYNNPAKSLDTSVRYAMKPSKQNHDQYARYFPGTTVETIKATFEATTQLGTRGAVEGFNLCDRIIAPNPVLSIPRRHKDVATDTLYSRTPAIDDGSTAAQFFIGRRSPFRSITPMGTSDKHFAYRLMDEIPKYGAMDRLISDNAKAQISSRVKDILRTFYIKDWQSEPYKGNQNFAERGWRDTKAKVNNLLNASGAPGNAWLLALGYICFVQNHTAVKSLGNRTPIEWLLGYTPDITVLLQFQFWEPVYYAKYDAKFPADSTENLGRFVGVAENVGHAMTFKILTEEGKIIHRAFVRSAAGDAAFNNQRANESAEGSPTEQGSCNDELEPEERSEAPEEEPTDGDDEPTMFKKAMKKDIVRSCREQAIRAGKPLLNIDTSALLGRTFINDPDEKGEQVWAKIDDIAPTNDWTADRKHRLFRFKVKIGERKFEKVLTYNKMLEWCERDMR